MLGHAEFSISMEWSLLNGTESYFDLYVWVDFTMCTFQINHFLVTCHFLIFVYTSGGGCCLHSSSGLAIPVVSSALQEPNYIFSSIWTHFHSVVISGLSLYLLIPFSSLPFLRYSLSALPHRISLYLIMFVRVNNSLY